MIDPRMTVTFEDGPDMPNGNPSFWMTLKLSGKGFTKDPAFRAGAQARRYSLKNGGGKIHRITSGASFDDENKTSEWRYYYSYDKETGE